MPGIARAQSAVVVTEQVRAELVADAPEGVGPGKPVRLGLVIRHQPHWHTYWKDPGDSGLATTLAWQLPAGVQAGDIEWPLPRRLPAGPLMDYGYAKVVDEAKDLQTRYLPAIRDKASTLDAGKVLAMVRGA